MSPKNIIIDGDPGQDDAVNLLLAIASPVELEILGITAVAGNVPLALTERNSRIICELAGRPDIKVFSGCEQPMQRKLVTAENVHGKTGIDGMDLFEPQSPGQGQHAVDYIIETLRNEPENTVTLVPTGPLTNIASAFSKAPDIVPKIREIVLMGGAMREGGNRTPSAEFNIYVDPQAAKVVFDCGRPLTVIGLDLTHTVLATPARIKAIRDTGTKSAIAVAGMLEFFNRHDTEKYGSAGGPLHDPCTIAWLLEPELFKGKQCNISIEVESELTMGHTAVDFWNVSNKTRNANWLYEVDAEGFYKLLVDRLARLP